MLLWILFLHSVESKIVKQDILNEMIYIMPLKFLPLPHVKTEKTVWLTRWWRWRGLWQTLGQLGDVFPMVIMIIITVSSLEWLFNFNWSKRHSSELLLQGYSLLKLSENWQWSIAVTNKVLYYWKISYKKVMI